MEQSIYEEVCSALGVAKEDESFQTTLMIYISASVEALYQVGAIKTTTVDISTKLDNLVDEPKPDENKRAQRLMLGYIFTSCRLLFDPPQPSAIAPLEKIKDEYLWRVTFIYDPSQEVLT